MKVDTGSVPASTPPDQEHETEDQQPGSDLALPPALRADFAARAALARRFACPRRVIDLGRFSDRWRSGIGDRFGPPQPKREIPEQRVDPVELNRSVLSGAVAVQDRVAEGLCVRAKRDFREGGSKRIGVDMIRP